MAEKLTPQGVEKYIEGIRRDGGSVSVFTPEFPRGRRDVAVVECEIARMTEGWACIALRTIYAVTKISGKYRHKEVDTGAGKRHFIHLGTVCVEGRQLVVEVIGCKEGYVEWRRKRRIPLASLGL